MLAGKFRKSGKICAMISIYCMKSEEIFIFVLISVIYSFAPLYRRLRGK